LRHFSSATLTKLKHPNSYFSSAEFIRILQNFPSLSDLTCNVVPEHIYDSTPPTFPNLLSLDLRHNDDMETPAIRALELVALPHLTCLRSDSPSLDPEVILPFLSRSACVIRELKCDVTNTHSADVRRQLEPFTFIETLDITVDSVNALLQGIDNELERPILPNLCHLTITYNAETNYPDLINTVHRRREHPETVGLQSVHIMYNGVDWYPPRGSVAVTLRRLIANGLDFTSRTITRPIWVWP
jgi:hypothetical protein